MCYIYTIGTNFYIYLYLIEYLTVNTRFIITHMNLLYGIFILVGCIIITFDISLTSLDVSSIKFLFNGLVSESIKFNFNLTNIKDMILVSSSYHTILCFKHMHVSILPIKYLTLSLSYCSLAITSHRHKHY